MNRLMRRKDVALGGRMFLAQMHLDGGAVLDNELMHDGRLFTVIAVVARQRGVLTEVAKLASGVEMQRICDDRETS